MTVDTPISWKGGHCFRMVFFLEMCWIIVPLILSQDKNGERNDCDCQGWGLELPDSLVTQLQGLVFFFPMTGTQLVTWNPLTPCFSSGEKSLFLIGTWDLVPKTWTQTWDSDPKTCQHPWLLHLLVTLWRRIPPACLYVPLLPDKWSSCASQKAVENVLLYMISKPLPTEIGKDNLFYLGWGIPQIASTHCSDHLGRSLRSWHGNSWTEGSFNFTVSPFISSSAVPSLKRNHARLKNPPAFNILTVQ